MGKPTWNTLSLDESLALRTAATRLALEFSDVFGTETIDRFLHSSFDQFAQHASITKFLPLVAERFARQRSMRWPRSRACRRRQTHRVVPVRSQRRPLPLPLPSIRWVGGSERSYANGPRQRFLLIRGRFMVAGTGFEPVTSGL